MASRKDTNSEIQDTLLPFGQQTQSDSAISSIESSNNTLSPQKSGKWSAFLASIDMTESINSQQDKSEKFDIATAQLIKMANKTNLERFRKELKNGFRNGRNPLFLFGAKGTPIEIDQYAHVKNAINKCKKYRGTTLDSIWQNGVSLDRPFQAMLFGDLMSAKDGDAWKIFCRTFLIEWLAKLFDAFQNNNKKAGDIYDGIQRLVTNSFETYQYPTNAYILTTNFDGAIPEYLSHKLFPEEKKENNRQQCLILSDARRIKNLPLLSIKNGVKHPWIISLRGDVYHTVCDNVLCSNGGIEISAYEALAYALGQEKKLEKIKSSFTSAFAKEPWFNESCLNDEAKALVENILTCPECGAPRRLTISFPGLEVKEGDISEMMSSAWSAFGANISLICTVGFSGNSDREIVNNILSFSQNLDCCFFHWTKFPQVAANNKILSAPKDAIVSDACKRLKPDRFFEIRPEIGSSLLTNFIESALDLR